MSDGKRTIEILKTDKKLIKDGRDFTIKEDIECIGVYFSGHWSPPCLGFTPRLAEFYNKQVKDREPMEIVFVSSDEDVAAFKVYFSEMPWAALKYEERKDKEELSRINKVQGVPAFIVFDKQGNIKDADGLETVQKCNAFPPQWKGKNAMAEQTLGLLKGHVVNKKGDNVPDLNADFIGIYFSAEWFFPCRQFTPILKEFYDKYKTEGKSFEIVFVSADKNKAAFDRYFAEMPWLAFDYDKTLEQHDLSIICGVTGIPAFTVVDKEGNIVVTNGRQAVMDYMNGGKQPF